MTARFLSSSEQDVIDVILLLKELKSQKVNLENAQVPTFSKIAALDKRIKTLDNYLKICTGRV